MIGGPAINMRIFHRRFILRAGVVALILIALWVIAIGPEPPARITISPDELVRAVTIQREALIDLCLMERVDPNGRDGARPHAIVDRDVATGLENGAPAPRCRSRC